MVAVTVTFLVLVVLLASRVAGPREDVGPPPTPEPTSEGVAAALPRPVVTRLAAERAPGRPCPGSPAATAPEISDRESQQEVALDALATVEDPRFEVVLAGPTHLGVVAVIDGDADAARAALPDVTHVVALSLPLRALGDGVDDHEAQLAWVVSALLDPVVRDVRDAVDGLPGVQTVAAWPSGGSVVVRWEAPVPAAVRDLAGRRADGSQVVVLACR